MPQFDINYSAVLLAAAAHIIIGFAWYSPQLFGEKWMKLSGVPKEALEKEKKKMPQKTIVAFIAALVMAYVLAHIIKFSDSATLVDGAIAGFWSWLGFIATTTLSVVLWQGKSVKLYILDNGHYLISLLVMGAILAAWQ